MTVKPNFISSVFFAFILMPAILHTQELVDSVASFNTKRLQSIQFPDSALKSTGDTLAQDTGLDTLIFYGADTTEGTLDRSTVILKSNAWVKYRGMEITAAKIVIEQPKRLMTAEAIPDSIDSAGNVMRYKGVPKFSEGGESFTGNKMEYNFDTRRGRVVMGETKMQDGIYYGENIRKIGDNTLYIRSGRFTTCEEKDPHFFFSIKRNETNCERQGRRQTDHSLHS